MLIKPPNERVKRQFRRFNLAKKFEKQVAFFVINPSHPSLRTEKLQPHSVGLYSFRIDKKYRAIFRIRNGLVEVVHITKHYQ